MNYNYKFSLEKKEFLNKELNNIINSLEYKECLKIYDNLITNLANNFACLNVLLPTEICIILLYLMKKGLFSADNDFVKGIDSGKLDFDYLSNLWGSRVATGEVNSRHMVNFISDVLVKMGYDSCSILTTKIDKKPSLFDKYTYNTNDIDDMLLCVILNNKRVFIDLYNESFLFHLKKYDSAKYQFYEGINFFSINNNKCFYIINKDVNLQLSVNEKYLCSLQEYLFAAEAEKRDLTIPVLYGDLDEFIYNNKNLIEKVNKNTCIDNIFILSELNTELSKKQNKVYKRLIKYGR